MPPRDPLVIRQKLGQTVLKVDSFFLRRTGFLANQTILKLGDYNLNCVPATISLEEARFLAVLTPSEINLFSKYKAGVHILILTFDDPDKRDIARFHIRVSLMDLEPVPNRKNICFLTLGLKAIPAEFLLFLGAYQEELEARQDVWEKLASQSIEFSPSLAVAVGAGLGFVLVAGEVRISVEILSFQTKKILLSWGEGAAAFSPGIACQLKLAFQGKPLSLDGQLDDERAFCPEFHPDWLSFVEECHFHRSLQQRPKGGVGV